MAQEVFERVREEPMDREAVNQRALGKEYGEGG
jgi:hypothetical protein